MSLTMPPAGQLITASGVTYWVSQDQNGTQVVPMGNYGWTGLLWLPIGVDSNNNQLVNVNAALPAGTNPIGEVTLGAGANAVGEVTLGAGTNAVGSVTLAAALPSGTNPLGTVALTGTQPPRLVVLSTVEVPYTAWINGSGAVQGYNIHIPLTLGARQRTFIFNNSLPWTVSGDTWAVDNETNGLSVVRGEQDAVATNWTVSSGWQAIFDSITAAPLLTQTSIFSWNTGGPSTVPSAGTLYINVREVL